MTAPPFRTSYLISPLSLIPISGLPSLNPISLDLISRYPTALSSLQIPIPRFPHLQTPIERGPGLRSIRGATGPAPTRPAPAAAESAPAQLPLPARAPTCAPPPSSPGNTGSPGERVEKGVRKGRRRSRPARGQLGPLCAGEAAAAGGDPRGAQGAGGGETPRGEAQGWGSAGAPA